MSKMTKAERLTRDLSEARMHADSGQFALARLNYEAIIKGLAPKKTRSSVR